MHVNGKAEREKRSLKDAAKYTSRYNGRPPRSAKADKVHPADYRRYVLPENGPPGGFFCDVCSHFDSKKIVCTLGYKPIHTIQEQSAQYDRTGRLALCRSIEID